MGIDETITSHIIPGAGFLLNWTWSTSEVGGYGADPTWLNISHTCRAGQGVRQSARKVWGWNASERLWK